MKCGLKNFNFVEQVFKNIYAILKKYHQLRIQTSSQDENTLKLLQELQKTSNKFKDIVNNSLRNSPIARCG